MSIVEFAEEILGYKLSSFQKEFLTKLDEASASNKQLYYIPPMSIRPSDYGNYILQRKKRGKTK